MTIKEFNHITEFLDYLYKLNYDEDDTKIDEFFQNLQLMVRLNKVDTFKDKKYLSGFATTPISFMGYLDSSYLKALNDIQELELGKLLNETEKEKIKKLFLLVGFKDTDAEKILKDLCDKLPCDVDILIKFPPNVDIREEYSKNEANIDNIEGKINGELNMNVKPVRFESTTVDLKNGIVPKSNNILDIFKNIYQTEYQYFESFNAQLKDTFEEEYYSETKKKPSKIIGDNDKKVFNYLEEAKLDLVNLFTNWETQYSLIGSIAVFKGDELGLQNRQFKDKYYLIRLKEPMFFNYCDIEGEIIDKEKVRRKMIIEKFQDILKNISNRTQNYFNFIEITKVNYLFILRRLLHIRNNFNSLFQGDGLTYSDTMTTVKDRKYEIITPNVNITKESEKWAAIKLFQKQVYTGRYGKRNSVNDVKQFMLYFLNSLANTNSSQNTRRMSAVTANELPDEELKRILAAFKEGQSGATAGDAAGADADAGAGSGTGSGTGGGKVNNSYKLKTKKLNKKNRNRRLMTKKN